VQELISNAQLDTSILNLIIILLVLTLIPTIIMMMTSFTRVIIVLSFTRSAMGTQQLPPNQILIGIALAITLFIMAPVIDEINETAYKPYMEEEINIMQALEIAQKPLSEFMYSQVRTEPKSLNLFLNMAGQDVSPESTEEIPLNVLIPAFVTGELSKAFKIGFMLFLPFIMIDMIVSSILMSMGMMMLPPAMISLPFKLLLFVMVDGWNLVMQTIVMSFGGGG